MYNFHYNLMIKKFNTKLLFTDTDSLCYEIQGKNIYEKIYKHKELFQLSSFPVYSNITAKIIRK